MRKGRLHSNNSLDTDVLNHVHHALPTKCRLIRLNIFQHSRESALGATIVVHVRVLHEVCTVFVNRIVRQVHVQIVQVCLGRPSVSLSCEASQALLKHEDAQRVNSVHQYVDS